MKKHPEILIFFSLLMFLLSCTSKEKKNLLKSHNGYTINGILASKESTGYIYLIDKNGIKVDSSQVKKCSFSLIGNVESPDKYYIQLNGYKKHLIILENSNYNVLLDRNKAMTIGGKLNTIFSKYQTKKTDFARQKSDFLEQFSKLNLSLRSYLKHVDSIRKIEKGLFENFIVENNNNLLSTLLLTGANLSSKEALKLKNKLKKSKDNTHLINTLKSVINDAKITEAAEKIQRRKPVPLFSGVNLKGRQTHLKKIIKNKKAFVIDFWASWCPPCREASPRLKELYQKYKHKGFDILTVSEDRSVNEWKSGVFIDDIEDWHHIYDDFNRISSMFKVGGLPHIVLLDENGKIIKNNISMNSLEAQLEKIFNEE